MNEPAELPEAMGPLFAVFNGHLNNADQRARGVMRERCPAKLARLEVIEREGVGIMEIFQRISNPATTMYADLVTGFVNENRDRHPKRHTLMPDQPDEIDRTIARYLADVLVDEPREHCDSLAKGIRLALKIAGFAIVVDEAQALERGREVKLSDSQLTSGPFNQRRVLLSRSEAERTVQQINGPINGIERMTGDDLQKWLPPQYMLRS